MTNYEYRKKALVFERPGMSPAERLVHAVLGIITELEELDASLRIGDYDTAVIEECGDLLWFTALAEDVANLPEDYALSPCDIDQSHMQTKIASVADVAKSAFVYNRPLPSNFAVRVANMTEAVRYHVETVYADMDKVRRGNLRKLAARYKAGKFSFDSANMRDVAAEYAAMEDAQ